uniref:DUF1619 domain-containing protein n=1 Tax=Angiostrongylus costaricensis TaxID=334426 RepID=A0A158PFL3_ANGCS
LENYCFVSRNNKCLICDCSEDIRYVENYTKEAWAEEATRVVQREILSHQLLDVLRERPLECVTPNPPQVKFPSSPAELGTHNVSNDTVLRVVLWCQKLNSHFYVENFGQLITSDALEVHLKHLDGTPIHVTNSLQPIIITGSHALMETSLPQTFESYQILDMYNFFTTAWNVSILLEMRCHFHYQNNRDSHAFFAYPCLPGTLERDHGFSFKLEQLKVNYFYLRGSNLFNKTERFYVSIGVLDNGGNSCVTYPKPAVSGKLENSGRSLMLRSWSVSIFF